MSRNVCLRKPNLCLCLLAQEGKEGAKAKGLAEYCLCYTIFPFPVGIFLWGWYKQQVWGCETWEIPDHCCLPLSPALHQPAESWLPSSLACLLSVWKGNSCPQLTWCWGDTWDGHTNRQKTSKGRIMSSAPRSLCFSPEVLWTSPQSWG